MKYYILLILLFQLDCNSNEDILEQVYPSKKDFPRILKCEKRILTSSKEENLICIFRSRNEETLGIFTKERKLIFPLRFLMSYYGEYKFLEKEKSWTPIKSSDEDKPFIIRTIDYYKLGNDEFDSIILEILSEEPPNGIFNTLLIYRNGIRIFDGLDLAYTLGEKFPRKILWKLDRDNSKLEIFSFDEKPLTKLYFQNEKFESLPKNNK
ncbi:MAG: hypothetical protein SFU98_22235 [Leptospiraceae bacterium]|nr:hypothetical protein [Leptospiraceae bacterium]